MLFKIATLASRVACACVLTIFAQPVDLQALHWFANKGRRPGYFLVRSCALIAHDALAPRAHKKQLVLSKSCSRLGSKPNMGCVASMPAATKGSFSKTSKVQTMSFLRLECCDIATHPGISIILQRVRLKSCSFSDRCRPAQLLPTVCPFRQFQR